MTRRTPRDVTYFHERWRALAAGVIETAGTTFLLLIAVRAFHAGPSTKALIAAAGSLGMLLSPVGVSFVQSGGWASSRAASFLAAGSGCCFLVAALMPSLPVFVAGSVLGIALVYVAIPLLTQMYQENYPDAERGRLFSRSIMIRVTVAVLFSHLGGLLLRSDIGRFRWLLLAFSAAFFFSSFCLRRCPTRPLAATGSSHPFRALRYAKEDRLFRWTLICWMLMGFGNLMMMPLRVEYLANPRYGMELDTIMIAFLTGVVPNLARLGLSPVWGWLFDRMNFFVLRVVLNLSFMLGILAFFTGGGMTGLIIGAIIFGISFAGGDVAWSLWVTKFAPPDRVADYMSVHTFFTGVRGVLAPMIAFHLVAGVSVAVLGMISAGLILVATLMLLPEMRFDTKPRKVSALVEEVSE